MTIYLKQSTASQEIPLGVFVDSTDGNTAETGLTIANTDIQLWKSGATTLANKNSGGATHISGGIYYAVLDATDTDTLGPLVIFVHVAGALAVRLECVVLAANVYDSMIGGTDALQVHANEISNNLITAAAIATDAIDADALAADAVAEINATVDTALSDYDAPTKAELDTAVSTLATAASIAALNDPTAAAIADAVWDEELTGATHNVATSAGRRLRAIPDSIASTVVDATPSATEFDTGLAGAYSDNHFNDQLVRFTSGAASGEVAVILSYTDATGTITLDEALANTPANGDSFEIITDHVHPKSQIADVVLDELLAGHSTAGSLGKAVADILADTGELQTDLANGGRLDLLIDAILEDTGTTLPATLAALNDLSAAQVNAEVVDALNVDTYAEPASVPAAAATLAAKLGWLFFLARNHITQSGDTGTIYADNSSTAVATSAVSDDGTTATRAKWTDVE